MSRGLGLQDRFALLAVGSSDAAASWVTRLREEGMSVAFAGSDSDRGASLAEQTGASFIPYQPLDRASTDRAVEQALELGRGRLDVLITHAPVVFEGSIEATPDAVFRDLLESNLTAAFRIARTSFAAMRAGGGGSLIHVTPDSGIRAAHETAAQSVMSAAVIALAELFAAEGAAHGIRANAVCPRDGTDVAPTIAWLASDEASHVSGATIRVDAAAGSAMVIDTRMA